MADDKRVDEEWKKQAREQAGPRDGPPATFSSFIASIGAQAANALGLDPEEGQAAPPKPDLDQARVLIDVLTVLEEKTRGNLTPDEAGLLKHLLHDLRMGFVEKSRQ